MQGRLYVMSESSSIECIHKNLLIIYIRYKYYNISKLQNRNVFIIDQLNLLYSDFLFYFTTLHTTLYIYITHTFTTLYKIDIICFQCVYNWPIMKCVYKWPTKSTFLWLFVLPNYFVYDWYHLFSLNLCFLNYSLKKDSLILKVISCLIFKTKIY